MERTTAGPAALYATEILEALPRALSLMDRQQPGATTGCFDRTYWAWKFTDFPGARFQEGVCALAYAYATDLGEPRFRKSPELLNWIEQGLEFWSRIQYPDGSFDEAYPYERSLAATAFTAFYVAEAIATIREALSPPVVERTERSLRRAAEWLCRNDEAHGFLSNHLAAAAAALEHVHRITGEARFRDRSRYFVDRIVAHQSSEGWYEEYGGADPGYQTHGTFYLARIWELTGDERLLESLVRSTRFLAHFVHPDRSIGGEYASRNTQTYYPAAFEILASVDEHSAWIAEWMRPAVRDVSAAGLRVVDAYNFFPFLNNLTFAHRATIGGSSLPPRDPSPEDGLVWFPEAGIGRVRHSQYDAYVSLRKGGVIKVFDRGAKSIVLSDCGYVGRTADGRVVASQFDDPQRAIEVEDARVSVHGGFQEVTRPTMSPLKFLAFRLFMITAGRIPPVARWLKNQLVRVLIYRRSPFRVELRREIEFAPDRVTIRDRLQGPDGRRLESLWQTDAFTSIHMGSSRYFTRNEVRTGPGSDRDPSEAAVDPKALSVGVTRERVVTLA